MNIYDVSKKAGVSIATVSRVLNGNANVSDKTKNKVLVAMKELDYTPNIFARGLGLNTMKTIGIMCSDSSDTYLANAVYYLEQELRRHNYDSILCCTGQDSETKKKYLDLLISKRVDGIILAGSQFVLNQPGSDNRYILNAAKGSSDCSGKRVFTRQKHLFRHVQRHCCRIRCDQPSDCRRKTSDCVSLHQYLLQRNEQIKRL